MILFRELGALLLAPVLLVPLLAVSLLDAFRQQAESVVA